MSGINRKNYSLYKFYNMSKKSVPTVPEGDGNTGHPPPSKNPVYRYDFVLNNYTEVEVCQVKLFLTSKCKKGGFGYEVGESGTPHLQGGMWLLKKERITGLKKVPGFERASFREIRNEEALIRYIQKDGNTWMVGFPKPIKIISDLYEWQANIERICMEEPDDRTINWFWEPVGNIGKSAFCKYMIVKHKALYCSGGKHSDLMNLVFNQNMDECRIVIFDIPRAHRGNVSYSALESIKNGLVCNTKYETGSKVFNSPHIIVMANFEPEEPEKLSGDRWNIVKL